MEASAEAASDHILLWLDEVIDPGSIPDPTDFTVTIDGVAQVMTDLDLGYQGLIGSPILEGLADQGTAFLVLRWEAPPPEPGPSEPPPLASEPPQASEPPATEPPQATEPPAPSVQVTYTPGTHPLRDVAGNQMDGFGPTDAFFFSEEVAQPFVDEGAGPDHLLLLLLAPIEPSLPAAADFSVQIGGRGSFTPSSITRQHPDLGYAILDLALPTSVLYGEDVFVTYPAPPPAQPSGAPASPSEPPTTPGPELRYGSGNPVGPLVGVQAYVSVAATPSRATPMSVPPDLTVAVSPADSTTGAVLVDLIFDNVTAAGTTTLTTTETTEGAAIPGALALGDPPTYFDLSTTAAFTGDVEVCIHYGLIDFPTPPGESNLQLIHEVAGVWVNVTTTLDTGADIICGRVSSFSMFAVVQAVGTYAFSGFFSPVDNRPTRNAANAGTAIPVHFSLGGDFGLDIFAEGYPKVRTIDCETGGVVDQIEVTVTAGASSLRYNAASNTYTYVWKTAKGWADSCREFVFVLDDARLSGALFSFR